MKNRLYRRCNMMKANIVSDRGVMYILTRLNERGYEACLVGGAVRDALRGVVPHDFDMATSALPEEILDVFSDCRVIETGIRHGTVTVLYENVPYEITTYRVDGDYLDNRHPEGVTFTRSIREDMARRDFTVNAMGCGADGKLIDLFGGEEDLAAGIIRAVGDPRLRFSEDALRILRALRFASVLSFRLDAATAEAVHEKKALLRGISAERIRDELQKLIVGVDAEKVLTEYRDVLAVIIPEIAAEYDFCQHNVHHIYDIYTHTLKAMATLPRDATLRFAALFHDIGKPGCFFIGEDGQGHFYGHEEKGAEMTKAILRRLRFDNKTRDKIVTLVRYHGHPVPESDRSVKRLLAAIGEENCFSLMQIMKADNLALAPMHHDRIAAITEAEKRIQAVLSEKTCLSLSGLSLNGKDLIRAGMRPGKEIGRLLEDCLSKVIDGELPNDRDALLQYAMAELKGKM